MDETQTIKPVFPPLPVKLTSNSQSDKTEEKKETITVSTPKKDTENSDKKADNLTQPMKPVFPAIDEKLTKKPTENIPASAPAKPAPAMPPAPVAPAPAPVAPAPAPAAPVPAPAPAAPVTPVKPAESNHDSFGFGSTEEF